MARRIPTWLVWSGVAVGVVALTGLGLIVAGALVFRDALHDFEVADQKMESVAERFGPIPSFRPDPGGAIPAERLEAFLEARRQFATEGADVEDSLATLSADRADTPVPAFRSVRKLRAGAGLLHDLARFVDQRNEALLQTEMGLGEYHYIYTLAYASWLGKPLDDGPSFQVVGERGYVLESAEPVDESAVRRQRSAAARESTNRLVLPMLRNQLADATKDAAAIPAAWREVLGAEIARMEADATRLPWEDGLPEPIEASLRPYREPLEESYLPMCSAIELGIARR